MNFVKIIIPLALIFLAFSCDVFEELFESDDPEGGGSIVGAWLESDATISLALTTNSNQTATNFLNSTGKLALSGDYQAKLTLLYETPENEDGETFLILTNPNGLLGFADTSYMFSLDPTGNDIQGALIVNANDDSEYSDDLTGNVTYTYSNSTLNVTASTLQSHATQLTTTVAGNISNPTVNIPANTPTTLSFNASQYYNFGSTITTFNEDGSFLSSEDTGLGDSTGTWIVIGDTLRITTAQEVEDIDTGEITYVDTTWSFNYVNTGNQFIISQTIPVCDLADDGDDDDSFSCDELYTLIEANFGLDEGSVTDASLIYQLFFERTDDQAIVKVSDSKNNQGLSQPHKIIKLMFNAKNRLDISD